MQVDVDGKFQCRPVVFIMTPLPNRRSAWSSHTVSPANIYGIANIVWFSSILGDGFLCISGKLRALLYHISNTRAYSELVWTTIRGKYNVHSPPGRGWGEGFCHQIVHSNSGYALEKHTPSFSGKSCGCSHRVIPQPMELCKPSVPPRFPNHRFLVLPGASFR